MGCDLHLVVEYKDEYGQRQSLSRGELNVPRDYHLFSALALGEGGLTSDLPFPARGIPPDAGDIVRALFYVEAAEVAESLSEMADDEAATPDDYAAGCEEWVQQEYRKSGRLPAPELHTPSYLNLREVKEALTHGGLSEEQLSAEFRAILAAMDVLAGRYSPEEVRLVFWFDGGG